MRDDNLLKSQAFKLKGRLFTLTVMQLMDVDSSYFIEQLDENISKAPKLFSQTPIVFDCSSIENDRFELTPIYHHAREKGLIPVAVQGGSAWIHTSAMALGMGILNASSAQDKIILDVIEEPNAPKTPVQNQTKYIDSPIRSGQQAVNQTGDLIIHASVGHGAEVLSSGHIHIYGTLRGKALAGIAGDVNARIFCQSLDAELLSIAGFYLVREEMEPIQKPCQVFLKNEKVCVELL